LVDTVADRLVRRWRERRAREQSGVDRGTCERARCGGRRG
jgi:hypothetical protein